MAHKSARSVNPSLSSDPRDKLMAALNWPIGKLKGSTYEQAPMYFDACRQWHERLSGDDRELVLTLAGILPRSIAGTLSIRAVLDIRGALSGAPSPPGRRPYAAPNCAQSASHLNARFHSAAGRASDPWGCFAWNFQSC